MWEKRGDMMAYIGEGKMRWGWLGGAGEGGEGESDSVREGGDRIGGGGGGWRKGEKEERESK